MDKYKLIISDCHLSAGRFFEGRLNPHEDFFFDEEMCDLFEYFSTGEYSEGPNGPREVELIINGDYLDFLSVPYHGEFVDAITEDIAVYKVDAIINGHPKVMAALKKFASLPGKKITYIIGNHDPELFFPAVRERIVRAWDPGGQFPSEKIQIIHDRDHITYEEGVEIHHGNQFEAVHVLNFENPVLHSYLDKPVLNIPWGSFYVLKIISRFKWEREYIDKVRPIRIFILFGLLIDTWFTVRFAFLSSYYFLKTRFVYSPKRRSRLSVTMDILKQEAQNMFQDLESAARGVLDQKPEIQTVIFGHTHRPMNRVWPDGKQYINTGTWTKMINLDWRGLGQQYRLTFAIIHIKDGKAMCDLRQWVGAHSPHRTFSG